MVLQKSKFLPRNAGNFTSERRFLALYLPNWPTDYLRRRDPLLKPPLALYEKIKGGLRLAAIDPDAALQGLRIGQTLADARALLPNLTVLECDSDLLSSAFADFADWHSNASPMVAVMTDKAPYGDLILDITGVAHLFGGEAAMLEGLLNRLQVLGYSVTGAIASTIGAAWAVSHFSSSKIVTAETHDGIVDALPVAALRLQKSDIMGLEQMGLRTVGELGERPRKTLQSRFGDSLLRRLDQINGHIAERMTPRLPAVEHFAEHKFADPIGLMDDVLAITKDLAVTLSYQLQAEGLGAQAFHLFLYRVDHKVISMSLNSARPIRDPNHIANLFRHRAQRLEGEYDPGFGIDMVRLAASSLDRLDAAQLGSFAVESGTEDIDRLVDRLSSRLGHLAVLRTQLLASHIPERAARLVPALAQAAGGRIPLPKRSRPLRLLPVPEPIAINAEVPDGLPASMIWRRQGYRLLRGAGPERLAAEWWRSGQRLELVQPEEAEPDDKPKPLPHVPDLVLFDPAAGTRDYYMVEDEDGRRFWVYRQGLYGGDSYPSWYMHGFFP